MSLDAELGLVAPAVTSEAPNTEAAQPNAATADAQTGGADGGTPSQEQKTFTQAELDDILQKRIAKAEARAERRVLRTLERVIPQPQSAPQQNSQPAADGKPSRVQYANDEAYVDALTDWKLDQREQKAKAETQHKETRTLQAKTEAFYAEAEKIAGFDREAFDDLPLTRHMVETLMDSDVTPKLMAYMASNPEEVERIAKLSPARQAAELGKLEAKAVEVKAPARSNAPPALGTVKGRSASSGAPDPSDTKAYIRWANEAERAR